MLTLLTDFLIRWKTPRYIANNHLIIDSVIIALSLFASHTLASPQSLQSTALEHTQQTSPYFAYTVLEQQPHNPRSFTQGWIVDNGTFYESSGLYGRSFLQRYTEQSNTTVYLPKKYFAEGLTLFNNLLYLLTWKEEVLLVIDPFTLAIVDKKSYEGEGWGLTHNKRHLIMSNGTQQLTFRHPDNFSIESTLNVKFNQTHKHSPTLRLNELEYIDGFIWANSWASDTLYAINSVTGCIASQINLSELRQQTVQPDNRNVLNGLAYYKERKGLWVTGKYWPTRYLINLPSLPFSTQVDC